MKIRTVGSVVVLAVALMATAAWACPGEGGCAKNCKKGATKVADKDAKGADKDAKGGCSKKCNKAAKTAADKDGKGGCSKKCNKSAKTVADKGDPKAKKGGCSGHKNAEKAADKDAKGGCSKKCNKAAKTVADKEGKAKKGCCDKAKGGKTVADRRAGYMKGDKAAKGGCSKKCGTKAKTAAGKGGCSKKCNKSATTVADKGEGCPIGKKVDAILTSLPSMKYKVGDDVTCCSKSAKAMAGEAKKPIQFVVGEDTFDDQGKAAVVLASALDKELQSMRSVQYSVGGKCMHCPTSAKAAAKKAKSKVAYRVAGFDFEDKGQAEKVVKLVSDAVAETHITYKVDGKAYHCDKMAGAECKKSGKKMTYVVGETETCCDKEAKIILTEAKIRRAVETAADAFAS